MSGLPVPGAVTTFTYWRLGDGNTFNGGCVGAWASTEWGGVTIEGGARKPAGAVDITQAEYDAIIAQVSAQLEVEAAAVTAALEASAAELQANFDSAVVKLMAGDPLTQAEAEALGGSR